MTTREEVIYDSHQVGCVNNVSWMLVRNKRALCH